MPAMETYEVTVTLKFRFGETSHVSAVERAVKLLENVTDAVAEIDVVKK